MATSVDHEENTEVVLSLCAGSSLLKGQIVFSFDSRYLFCCSGSVVKVFNTANGQCAQQLFGHTDIVTGLLVNPANKLQLLSCGLDGHVNQWDYGDGVLLRTHAFYMPLHGLVSINSSGQSVAVIARRPQASHCCVLQLPLKKDRHSKNNSGKGEKKTEKTADADMKADVLLHSCASDYRTVSHGCNGDYIASVENNQLSVYSFQKKKRKKTTTDKSNPFTCVACHPTESCIATGHRNGKITIWWNVFSKEKTVMSSIHWHSLAVQALAFTPEGSCLLSGGHECVLVKWQMNSSHKDFLPRLGAPIHSIVSSPDGTLFATSHSDNVLQLINHTFHIIYAIRGLARAHLGSDSSNCVPVGLLCDPRSKALVTNGRPGHLQFYCMNTDTQLYNLDIVGQNYISPDNLKKPATVTEVERAAFDVGGNWLATYECWDDGCLTPEYRIKFWHYNKKQQNFQLNTTVESPHNSTVGCLQFRPYLPPPSPHLPTLVSTGADGLFKLWTLVKETHLNKTIERWTCDSVGYYRNKPASVARFSEDGSVLAVAFDSTLTVWETDTNVPRERLAIPSCDEHIKCLEFGGKTCSHFVVTTTSSHLTVWNLFSFTVHLRIAMKEALLATDGDLMSAVTADGSLYIFRPDKWEPLFQKEKITDNPVISAIFLPQSVTNHSGAAASGGLLDWQRQSRLYLLDSKQQLFSPDYLSNVTRSQSTSSRSQVQLKQTLPQTPFSKLLGSTVREKDTTSTTRAKGSQWHKGNSSAVLDVMNTSVPTMEPFHTICQQLTEILLLRNKGGEEPMEEEADTDSDEGDSMATDSS